MWQKSKIYVSCSMHYFKYVYGILSDFNLHSMSSSVYSGVLYSFTRMY